MKVGTRTHVPFDTWSMQVEVPVSQLVTHGDLAWSCGQCPLDGNGQVLFKEDLPAQAERVCDYIEEILARGGVATGAIAKLILYYVEKALGDLDAMLTIFRRRFGPVPLLVPVAVPHFYYDGMMIEVDVFAGAKVRPLPSIGDAANGVSIAAVEDETLIWTSVKVDAVTAGRSAPEQLASAVLDCLEKHALSPSGLVSDHWFVPVMSAGPDAANSRITALKANELITDPAALVQTHGTGNDAFVGELTFVRGTCTATNEESRSLTIKSKRFENLLWISGTCSDGSLTLVEQTKAIMPAIGDALSSEGMTFADVAKSTTHYVGGATPDELHDNMAVRHSFYSMPGPTSTGLPVQALGDANAHIAIDVIAVV